MAGSRGAKEKALDRRFRREPGPLPRLSPRADIQGLRALAVVLVLLDHAGVPWLGGGFVSRSRFYRQPDDELASFAKALAPGFYRSTVHLGKLLHHT